MGLLKKFGVLKPKSFKYQIKRTHTYYMSGEIWASSEEAARERIEGFKDSVPPELFDHTHNTEIVHINVIKETDGSI